ncbi:MAG: nucleotidyltransferase substrate binding protein [Chitinispirillia bacterium]|nr:nucleotidyltransferase substrate binding protein [Chitinispirillia bacterium]MCL2241079.1 nucleotidyltransferase substrate binding protein [Chitinispirillia bacterium]
MALPEKWWVQRLDNYTKAFAVLERIHRIQEERELSEAERMGLIQSFEFTFELAWNLMKDYLRHKGIFDITGSKDAVRAAFKNGIIDDGAVWMDMIDRRNETAHTYEEEVAIRVASDVSNSYVEEMRRLMKKMAEYSAKEE